MAREEIDSARADFRLRARRLFDFATVGFVSFARRLLPSKSAFWGEVPVQLCPAKHRLLGALVGRSLGMLADANSAAAAGAAAAGAAAAELLLWPISEGGAVGDSTYTVRASPHCTAIVQMDGQMDGRMAFLVRT
jgi:hypothetical protein